MKAIKGVLLTCDAAVKQILLTLNEKQSFIVDDLDDFHVVIKADMEFAVRRQLEAEAIAAYHKVSSARPIATRLKRQRL